MKLCQNFRPKRLTEIVSCCCRSFTSGVSSSGSNNKNGGSEGESPHQPQKKYSETLILPKTDFQLKIPYEKRNEHELKIASRFQFDQLYGLQRLWREEQPEFILHDGPPYANGDAHIGHAVNKILKDVTNRYKLLRGYRINYTPGWDCHGLPIELKALRDNKIGFRTDPLQIRNAARIVAQQSMGRQLEAFRRWGVMAEWNSPYQTVDKSYIKSQLQIFYELHEKGLVFRELKPVYWSPSSRTALAEAELEYNSKHESPSVHVTMDLNLNLGGFLAAISRSLPAECTNEIGPVKAVIWTTAPWTLPSNAAIAFNEKSSYSLVFSNTAYEKTYYIVASALVPQFVVNVGKDLRVLLEFEGEHLKKFGYQHPWFDNVTCPFVHGDHVIMDKGTGLVHTAPAHGQDDFVLGLKHKLHINSYVDTEGNFDDKISALKGLSVLTAGNNAVIKHLGSKILHKDKLTHSYPYDWRTKKPVLIKASMQWFMDTEKLKKLAADELEKVNIFPQNVQNGMLSQLMKRPFWCISRQRAWGVPIPVLYHRETGKPLVERTIVNRLCDLVELSGNADAWWDAPVSTLIQNDDLSSKYEKGNDIFDIWLDSGVSWHMLGSKVADLYLEGQDQFQGWFQSSLLTSVALRGYSPYKNIFVHGFVVDDDGRKMSKSVGNVVDPVHVVEGCKIRNQPAYGADVLRWWTVTQGSADGSNISVSKSLLKSCDESVQKLRNTLRFLVSFCNEADMDELEIDDVSYDELMYIDQHMLSVLTTFQKQVTEHYEGFNYHRALMTTLHFATTEVSAHYFTWIKDRLYCDSKESQSRKSCIYVLNQIYLTLGKILAPVVPFLVEESYSHYTTGGNSMFKSTWFNFEDKTWENTQVTILFDLVKEVRTNLNHLIGSNNPKDIWVELHCNKKNYDNLMFLHPVDGDEIDKCDSELCDILQVSGIDLYCNETSDKNDLLETEGSTVELNNESIKFTITPHGVGHSLAGFSIGIAKTEMFQCARCRRYCCSEGSVLCSRCLSVMNRLHQQQKQTKEQIISEVDALSDEKKRKLAT